MSATFPAGIIVTSRPQTSGPVVITPGISRPGVQVGLPDAHYAVLVDGGERVFTRDTDPGELARPGDIWLAPQ